MNHHPIGMCAGYPVETQCPQRNRHEASALLLRNAHTRIHGIGAYSITLQNTITPWLRRRIRIETIWRFNRHARREKTAISFSMGWDAETYNKETIKNEFLWKQLLFLLYRKANCFVNQNLMNLYHELKNTWEDLKRAKRIESLLFAKRKGKRIGADRMAPGMRSASCFASQQSSPSIYTQKGWLSPSLLPAN